MTQEDQAKEAIETLRKHIKELTSIRLDDINIVKSKLARWKTRVVQDIKKFSHSEAKKFEAIEFRQKRVLNDFDYTRTDMMMDMFQLYIGNVGVLIEELIKYPASILDPNAMPSADAFEFHFKVLHPEVIRVSKTKFIDGHYSDSVEAAFKEFNACIKAIHKEKTNNELDGKDLMLQSFGEKGSIIVGDTSMTGRSIQEGYRFISAGAMAGIRNPHAHGNVDLSPERAMHFLYVASLLFHKLGERITA